MALAIADQLPSQAALATRAPRRRWLRWFALVVVLPTLLAGAYYGLVASDVYISQAKFTIRGDRPAASGALELALFGAANGGEDALIVREYVLSHGMVAELDRQLALRDAYGAARIDWWQRLPADASGEDLVAYFEDMVDITFEPESSVTSLRVRAFNATDARRIAAAIMAQGETLVNGLSERMTDDLLGFARAELARAESRVATARRALTAYRDRTDALDPSHEAGAILGIVGNLEDRLAQERATLMELRSYLREDNARIAAAKARIGALAAQIAEERARLTGSAGGRLSRVVEDYEAFQLELEFARSGYTSMLSSLEAARVEAQRQQKYLIPVVTPNLPDEPLEPERLLGVLTVLLGALACYAIGALVVAAIREHLDQ
jgi:capsular polysaccharide transport system permease protein